MIEYIILGIAAAVVIVLLKGLVKVQQYEKGMIERWGAFEKSSNAGLRFVIPFVQSIKRVNMREQVIDVPPQEIITEDNVVVTIDAVIYYQIIDPKKAIYEIEDFELAIVKLAQTTLRNLIGEMTLDVCLTSRELINNKLRSVLDEATDKWGTKVNRIEVQRIDPPNDIQIAMHKQKTSEQEKRSMALIATGRKEAAVQDREAAIQLAEGEKKSKILRSEGEAQSIRLVADAQAEAIKAVSESANKYFNEKAQLNKRLDIIPQTFSTNTKLIVPSDSQVLAMTGLEGSNVIPIRMGKNE